MIHVATSRDDWPSISIHVQSRINWTSFIVTGPSRPGRFAVSFHSETISLFAATGICSSITQKIKPRGLDAEKKGKTAEWKAARSGPSSSTWMDICWIHYISFDYKKWPAFSSVPGIRSNERTRVITIFCWLFFFSSRCTAASRWMALGRMSFFGASLKKSAGGWEGKKAVRHAERKNSHTHTKKKHGIGAIFIRTEEQDQQQQDEKKKESGSDSGSDPRSSARRSGVFIFNSLPFNLQRVKKHEEKATYKKLVSFLTVGSWREREMVRDGSSSKKPNTQVNPKGIFWPSMRNVFNRTLEFYEMIRQGERGKASICIEGQQTA